MRQIFLASEKSQKRPALLRSVVADGSAQHRVAGLQRIEDRPLRGLSLDFEFHVAADMRQGSQVRRAV